MRSILLLLLLGLGIVRPAWASPRLPIDAGYLLSAEQRFDPAVQRLLAQRAMNALPLANGRLFFIVPAAMDTRLQQEQIRYLEYLLERRNSRTGLDRSAQPDARR